MLVFEDRSHETYIGEVITRTAGYRPLDNSKYLCSNYRSLGKYRRLDKTVVIAVNCIAQMKIVTVIHL